MFFLPSNICLTIAVRHGYGRHLVAFEAFPQSLDLNAVDLWSNILLAPDELAHGLPKLAVVAFLARLLNTGRRHRIFLWSLAISCQLGLLSNVVVLWAGCGDPVTAQRCWAGYWPPRMVWGWCQLVRPMPLSSSPALIGAFFADRCAVFSALAEIYLALYPTWVLWHLQLPRKQKITLSFALGLGWL